MPSTYSNLKIQLMASGENNNTWGDITNTNLGTAIEEAIVGSADVTFASANVTLSLTDTNTTQAARNLRLNCTGTTGGARNLVVPAIEKFYIVNNGCADAITIKNSTGTGVAVPAGYSRLVYNNGTNVVDAVSSIGTLDSLTVAGAGSFGAASTIAGNLTLSGLGQNTTGSRVISAPASSDPSDTTRAYVTLGTTAGGSSSSSYISFATNSYGVSAGERMRIDPSGNVGIGTSSPGQKLDVAGSTAAYNFYSPITAGTFGTTTSSLAVYGSTGSAGLTNTLTFTTNSTERIRVDNTGNVGIGTSSITKGKLEVAGVVASYVPGVAQSGFWCYNGGAVTEWFAGQRSGTDHSYKISTVVAGTYTDRVTVTSSGYVGINNTSPGTQLNVGGDSVSANLFGITDTNASGKSWGIGPSVGTADPTIFGLYDYSSSLAASYYKTGASGYWAWYTSGSERMRIDNNGNVGIGLSGPVTKLQVYGGASTTDTRVTIGNAAENVQIGIDSANNGVIAIGGAHSLALYTNNIQRFSIDSGGTAQFTGELRAAANVTTGYGVSTGDVALELGGMRTGSGNCYIDLHSTSGTDYEARIIRDSGTNGGFTITNTGTGAFLVKQTGAGDIIFQTNSTDRTRVKSDGVLYQPGRLGVGTSSPTYMLDVVSDDTASGYTARLRAPSSGSGQTVLQFTDNGATAEWGHFRAGSGGIIISNASAWSVDIAGSQKLSLDSSGNLTATGNITAYSDLKLKSDLQVIPDALDKVNALTGYTYLRTDTQERQAGLIAQDVQKVLPEVVAETEDGTLTLAYGNTIALLVEAIKELKAEVEAIKAAQA